MKLPRYSKRGAILLTFAIASTCAFAQLANPNGFPSGAHYNLNIHGKKADYNCTKVVYDEAGNPVYGNSIFVPESGQGIQILIKSGKKGGKGSELYQSFQATDACAVFDGSPAVVELPPNENGYRVYARALAKPGGNATLTYGGSLFSAVDEYGNNLLDLGLVTSAGVASTGQALERTRGRSVAVDITGLFLWSGTVCNIAFSGTATGTQPLCWVDNPLSPDGLITPDDSFTAPVEGLCSQGILTNVPVSCVTYVNEWIFNIAELVESDWLMDNDGSKLIQLRFYPQ
jgi:hypothetical protein